MPTKSQAEVPAGKDYSSLEELMRHEEQHRDWDFSFLEKDSWLLVVAPHAKTIEPFTEIIAKEIAGKDYSLFIFEGLRRKSETRKWLHISSDCFAHPDLERLQAQSTVTLSVHGAANNDNFLERVTHIGGQNDALRDLVWDGLNAHGFSVLRGIGTLAGMSDKNLVNRTKSHGVQLEVSRSEREYLGDNPVRRKRYVDAVRWAIHRYGLSKSGEGGEGL
ncbi:MAG: poly-gamma-glutamate hydrolase family protein [Candidatus Melainabacteria bacterium]|nr:poly-gamma-glutamate hydrolase family protein [Candidatus Melainabacteria bacterium]